MKQPESAHLRLRLGLAAACLALGVLQFLGHYCYMSPDGLSYLDLSDAWLSGTLRGALSSYWSPVYPALIALARRVLRPTPYWEFTAVHAVNLCVFALVIACFDRLLMVLYRALSRTDSASLLAPAAWFIFGYAMLAWSSISLIQVTRPTPDMLVALVLFIASILTVEERGESSVGRSIALGSILAIGYWVKAAVFPLGLLWLASFGLLPRPTMKRVKLALAGSAAFAVVAAPLVAALSYQEHRFTIGDSARLNYAWVLNGVTPFVHWEGAPPGSGTPVHPTRQLSVDPPMFAFASPFKATYSPWLVPPYWYEGVHTHFRFHELASSLAVNSFYLGSVLSYSGSFILAIWLAALVVLCRSISKQRAATASVLFSACLGMMTLYMVVAIRPRYIAPLLALLLVSLVGALRLPAQAFTLKTAVFFALALYVDLALPLIRSSAEVISLARAHREPHEQWLIAREIRKQRVPAGSAVGSIGYAGFPFWARIARDQVVAEVYDPKRFTLDPKGYEDHQLVSLAQWPSVLAKFQREGVRVIVAKGADLAPDVRRQPAWHHISGTTAWCFLPGSWQP